MTPGSDHAAKKREAEQLLIRLRPQLQQRIRRMMSGQARLVGESGDFLGAVQARVLERVHALDWRDEAHFLRLATRIASHLIVDDLRRPRMGHVESMASGVAREALQDRDQRGPASRIAEAEQLHRMLEVMDGLEEDHQRVIELRNVEGLSFREIGALMGRSENAAQLLHNRARLALGRLLRD